MGRYAHKNGQQCQPATKGLVPPARVVLNHWHPISTNRTWLRQRAKPVILTGREAGRYALETYPGGYMRAATRRTTSLALTRLLAPLSARAQTAHTPTQQQSIAQRNMQR